ncbi:unnamed protein product [Vicia faba]|uniref:Uncharacterized protein n=1 Tax=Vicia faba TaxID=3906 RepID=A0AAV1AEG3_VICFA|nr:unnamed protein product [Vicia faba]
MKRTKQSHPHNIGHLSMIHSRRRLHHLRRQHLEATTWTTEAPAAPYLHRLHAYRLPCRSTSFGLPHIAIATPIDSLTPHTISRHYTGRPRNLKRSRSGRNAKDLANLRGSDPTPSTRHNQDLPYNTTADP